MADVSDVPFPPPAPPPEYGVVGPGYQLPPVRGSLVALWISLGIVGAIILAVVAGGFVIAATNHRDRAVTIGQVEASVKKMAQDDIAQGSIVGPILDISCTPVSGQPAVLDCFVVVKNNNDGSQDGYDYHATVNWDTGRYTYGHGAPGTST